MKIVVPLVAFVLLACEELPAVELQTLPFRVIYENDLFVRNREDRRYNVWTDDPAKAGELLSAFAIPHENRDLPKPGEILAVLLNDSITEELVQIVYSTAMETFADYAWSGATYKLEEPEAGKKYTRLTAVIFTPKERPSHIGIRGMVQNGLSEYMK